MSFSPFRQKLAKRLSKKRKTPKRRIRSAPSANSPGPGSSARITFGSANLCENDRRVAVLHVILEREHTLEEFYQLLSRAPKKIKTPKQKASVAGLFKQAKQLIGTLRELTVQLIDTIMAWRRVYVKPQAFIHEGKNYLTNAMHSLYPTAQYPAFIEFLGYPLAENPMAIPPYRPQGEDRSLDWESYLRVHSFLQSEQETFGRAEPPPMFLRNDMEANLTDAKKLEKKEKLRQTAFKEYRAKAMAKVLKKQRMVEKTLQVAEETRKKAEQRHAEKRNEEMRELELAIHQWSLEPAAMLSEHC